MNTNKTANREITETIDEIMDAIETQRGFIVSIVNALDNVSKTALLDAVTIQRLVQRLVALEDRLGVERYQSDKLCERCEVVRVLPEKSVCNFCDLVLEGKEVTDPADYASWSEFLDAITKTVTT